MNTQTAAETQDRVGQSPYTPDISNKDLPERLRKLAAFLMAEAMPVAAAVAEKAADALQYLEAPTAHVAESETQAKATYSRDDLWLLYCANFKGAVTDKHVHAFEVAMDAAGVARSHRK